MSDHKELIERLRTDTGAISVTKALDIIQEQAAEIERLRKVVAFFASCIKSGEPWDAYCDGALEEVGLGPQHRGAGRGRK